VKQDLSIAARLLSARVRKDIGEFLNVAQAQQGHSANHFSEAATVAFEEVGPRLLACIGDPVERMSFELQLIAQLPTAVEGIRQEMLAARANAQPASEG
jgi:hypothetical protein